MPAYTVRRDIETVATAHAASESVAESTAVEEVREQLAAADGDGIDDFEITASEIYEFPSGPFDPHRVTLAVTLTVTADATDEAAAAELGAETIDEILAGMDLDGVEYVGPARVDAPTN